MKIIDSLQKKLGKMERMNSSPSLQYARSDLIGRIKFILSILSRDVKNIRQSESRNYRYLLNPNDNVTYEACRGFVSAKLLDYKLDVGHTGYVVTTTTNGKPVELSVGGEIVNADTIIDECDPESLLTKLSGSLSERSYFREGKPLGISGAYYLGGLGCPNRTARILSGNHMYAAMTRVKKSEELIGHLEEKLGRTLIKRD